MRRIIIQNDASQSNKRKRDDQNRYINRGTKMPNKIRSSLTNNSTHFEVNQEEHETEGKKITIEMDKNAETIQHRTKAN